MPLLCSSRAETRAHGQQVLREQMLWKTRDSSSKLPPFNMKIKHRCLSRVLQGRRGSILQRILGPGLLHLAPFLRADFLCHFFSPRSQCEAEKRCLHADTACDGRELAGGRLASLVPELSTSIALSLPSVRGNQQRRLSTGGNTDSAKQTVPFRGRSLFSFLTLVTSTTDVLSEPPKTELIRLEFSEDLLR